MDYGPLTYSDSELILKKNYSLDICRARRKTPSLQGNMIYENAEIHLCQVWNCNPRRISEFQRSEVVRALDPAAKVAEA
jgi:hypothetical protein